MDEINRMLSRAGYQIKLFKSALVVYSSVIMTRVGSCLALPFFSSAGDLLIVELQ